jgi:hypothetical protein
MTMFASLKDIMRRALQGYFGTSKAVQGAQSSFLLRNVLSAMKSCEQFALIVLCYAPDYHVSLLTNIKGRLSSLIHGTGSAYSCSQSPVTKHLLLKATTSWHTLPCNLNTWHLWTGLDSSSPSQDHRSQSLFQGTLRHGFRHASYEIQRG